MKKHLILFILTLLLWGQKDYAQSGTLAPDGIYVPRLTTTQRNAIVSPSIGQLIYNTNENCFNIYTQPSTWQSLCAFDRLPLTSWTKKADLPAAARVAAVGFAIGQKGYVGLGADNDATGIPKSDFWEYDPVTNAYTQKASFPVGGRAAAVGFSIGNKGYVGTGSDAPNNQKSSQKKDFWEYDPTSNQWTQKADFGGVERNDATGFSIGNKGYIGTGLDSLSNHKKDFWEYDPANNQWTQKADLGTADSTKRYKAFGLCIGNKGYIGGGEFEGVKVRSNDFWEYNPTTNQWTEKAPVPVAIIPTNKLTNAMTFSLFDKGYVGGGSFTKNSRVTRKEFFEYNQATNQWLRIADFGGGNRFYGIGFSIANKGYVGFGANKSSLFATDAIPFNDLWSLNVGFAEITQQGNSFNQANQLVKFNAASNLSINGISLSEAYKNITPLLNNWVNYGSITATAAYYKDANGIVRLKGTLKNGLTTSGATLFNLPEGYRPKATLSFAVMSSALNIFKIGRIDIQSDGTATIILGGNDFLSLDGITFRAEQ